MQTIVPDIVVLHEAQHTRAVEMTLERPLTQPVTLASATLAVMQAVTLKRMTVEEYIALDRAAEEPWEYIDGEAFAMAGGTTAHGLVARNLVFELVSALRGKECVAFGQGQKIATVRTRAYHYPDASVVCPPFTKDERDVNAFTSPFAVFEVLSPTTEDYDRGKKFVHYRSNEVLREYVLIDPVTREVERRTRTGPHQWLSTDRIEGELALAAIGVTLSVERLWSDLDRVAPPG